MNICKRILLLFLLCVVLFAQYSPLHTVYATSNDGIATLNLEEEDLNGTYTITHYFFTGYNKSTCLTSPPVAFIEGNMNLNTSTTLDSGHDYSMFLMDRFHFSNSSGDRIFSKGSKIELTMTNLINKLDFGTKIVSLSKNSVYEVGFYFRDISGNYEYAIADNFTFTSSTGSDGSSVYNLNATLESVPCDAYQVLVGYRYYYDDAFGYSGITNPSSYTVKRLHSFDNSRIIFEETPDDGTKGLLGNIIQIVTNIWNGIVELPSKIASSIKGFFDNVVSAVVNLGTTILDGIKNLFVPTEEDITAMKDKWDTLLSDRFGALYQTTELISDYASAFTEQEKNTITMPSVIIPLAGSEFVFGGWEVQVVPDGFTVVIDTLKLIISVICTIWFVNGLKNRFDKLVGGANNI